MLVGGPPLLLTDAAPPTPQRLPFSAVRPAASARDLVSLSTAAVTYYDLLLPLGRYASPFCRRLVGTNLFGTPVRDLPVRAHLFVPPARRPRRVLSVAV